MHLVVLFDGTVKDDDEETKINSHSSEDIMINDNNYHSHSMSNVYIYRTDHPT